MNKKYFILSALILATATIVQTCIAIPNNQYFPVSTEPYADVILSVYTDSPDFAIIETANWQYMYIQNIQEVNYLTGEDISEFQGKDILVKELKQLNNKTVTAKVLIL